MAAFLGRVPDAPSAVVLEGEAGIGKSTLWLEGVSLARARGIRVVSSRPAEAEQALVYVGLGDLLDDVLDEVLPALAPPRRRALGVAMLRDDASGAPVDSRAVGLAVRDVLQGLGEDEPVVLAVDDVQWLDASSSAALAFALRRLPASRVLVLLARRSADGPHTSVLEDALPPAQVRRVPVGPLSVGALHRLLRDRLGTSFARQTLLATPWKTSGRGRRSDRPSSTRAMTCTSYATTPRSWTTCTWSRSSRRASLGASTKTIPTPASAPTENQAGPRGATSGRPRTRPLVVHPTIAFVTGTRTATSPAEQARRGTPTASSLEAQFGQVGVI